MILYMHFDTTSNFQEETTKYVKFNISSRFLNCHLQVQEMGPLTYFLWNCVQSVIQQICMSVDACLSNDEYGPKNHARGPWATMLT